MFDLVPRAGNVSRRFGPGISNRIVTWARVKLKSTRRALFSGACSQKAALSCNLEIVCIWLGKMACFATYRHYGVEGDAKMTRQVCNVCNPPKSHLTGPRSNIHDVLESRKVCPRKSLNIDRSRQVNPARWCGLLIGKAYWFNPLAAGESTNSLASFRIQHVTDP